MSLVCLSSLSSVFSDSKFEQDHVRRALRQSGGREDRAVNLLLEVTATSDAQFFLFISFMPFFYHRRDLWLMQWMNRLKNSQKGEQTCVG